MKEKEKYYCLCVCNIVNAKKKKNCIRSLKGNNEANVEIFLFSKKLNKFPSNYLTAVIIKKKKPNKNKLPFQTRVSSLINHLMTTLITTSAGRAVASLYRPCHRQRFSFNFRMKPFSVLNQTSLCKINYQKHDKCF